MRQELQNEINKLSVEEKVNLIEFLVIEVTGQIFEQQFLDEEPEGLAVRSKELSEYRRKTSSSIN